jgi:hypothetical protein
VAYWTPEQVARTQKIAAELKAKIKVKPEAAPAAPAPLTDEQIKKLYALNHWHEISHFTWGAASVVVRAVEVAHGITKGGGND